MSGIAFAVCCILLFFHSTSGSWVDPDSTDEVQSTSSMYNEDARQYQLVFSDEFELDGRTFHDGSDPWWTALEKNDYTNLALHYYSADNAVTSNGVLNITTERKVTLYKAFNEKTKKFYADKKHIQSAMVQSWNKFCFTGGIVEFSAKLPGDPKVGGLWPALWMLGNLARATYVGSSDYMWPYSYNKCDQDKRLSQAINACDKINHYGLEPEVGRGAPEIDLIEAMQGDNEKLPNTHITRPYQSCSLQIAPGVENNRPVLGMKPKKGHWYEGMEYNNDNETRSELNPFFYGVTLEHKPKTYTYQADALSANTGLNTTHYDEQHIYRVEWEPPAANGTGGYIRWYTDGEFVYGVTASNLAMTGSEIPSEAMYLIMNTAVASSWGFPAPCPDGCKCSCFECGNPECACALPSGYCDNFPAHFEIDYVRVYQAVNEPKHTLGCSPESKPTELYIKGHEKRYMENGDRHPLRPVATGGAVCVDESACGGKEHGKCSPRGVCECKQGFAGPSCQAYAGFYENESRSELPDSFGWSRLYVPSGLIAVAVLLGLGFLASCVVTLRSKGGYHKYKKVDLNSSMEGPSVQPNTYQNSSEYALPPKQKVVTYCVIDGRLVDQ